MAQWVTRLLSNHEDPGLNPQRPCKSRYGQCTPVISVLRCRLCTPRVHQPANLAILVSSRFIDPVSKFKLERAVS